MTTTDWGRRDPGWKGIHTEVLKVGDTAVRTLRHRGSDGGTPQLLVHGLGGSAVNWLEVMGPLSSRGPVVAVDLPGFGRTRPPRPEAARVGSCAAFLAALCDRLGWSRVELHGSSMGGLVAVLAAAREPDLVHRLVLCAPALPLSPRALASLPLSTLVRFAPFLVPGLSRILTRAIWRRLSAERLHEASLASVHARPDRLRPAVRDLGLENYRSGKRLAWRTASLAVAGHSLLAHLLGSRHTHRALDAVTAPTLVVHGTEDRLVPVAIIEGLAVRRPDWRIVRLSGAGHLPMLETPGAYLEATGAFARPDRRGAAQS